MSKRLQIDLLPHEIVTTQTPIAFEVPAGTDTSEIGRHVAVLGAAGVVRPTRVRNVFRWASREGLTPGQWRIEFDALTDTRSRKLTESVTIPFTVVDTAAKIPARLRLQSFSRVRFDETGGCERLSIASRPRGKFVEFFKAADRRTGLPVELAYDEAGNALDSEDLVAEYTRRTLGRHGRIAPALAERLRAAKPTERIMVDVWIETDEAPPAAGDRPLHDGDVGNAAQRAGARRRDQQRSSRGMVERLGKLGKVVAVDEMAPVLTLELPASAVRELGRQDGIGALLLHEEAGIDDLDDSIAIARSATVHAAGETGTGIRVAVWEDGPTSTADLVIAGRYTTSPSTSDHSQNVHAIVRNDEDDAPHGHAPGCSLYSANSKVRAALTWAVGEQDCTVVNQSFHRSSEPGSAAMSSDDLYGDWLALHWPYPLIVHAAGNFWDGDPDAIDPPEDEYVNHKGYNTISVGNHVDDASAINGSSVFRNPSSPHGDRELPEICANGTSVTADGITMTGTSQASPAVAGVAALLQGTSSTLRHWPEGCRAILAAGASRNVRGDTWWRDVSAGVDARDGAGSVDAAESRAISLNRRWRGAGATRRGWDVGLLSSGDFGDDGLSTFDYKVSVPAFWWAPRKVKVALAWTSKVASILGLLYMSSLTVDLDLLVFDEDGSLVGYSGSWDNSYEIVDFVGRPGHTYTIRVRRWSGTDPTWFGIAWTVTGGFLLPFPVEVAEGFLPAR